MRVLQLIDSLNAGGAERMAINIANAWANSGHDSFLCTTRQEGLLKSSISPKVSYLFLNKRSALDPIALWKLWSFVKTQKVDIIHAHATSFFSATIIKLLHPSIKLIWHDHYGECENLDKRAYGLLKICSRFFSAILCVNEQLLIWCQQKLRTDKVLYMSNFVAENTDELTLVNIEGFEGKRLLCVANLRPQKDHVTLINAFNHVKKYYPEWSLHCVGHDFRDAYSAELKRLVKSLDLESNIFFYGSRTDVGSFIRTCDIAVLSSRSEGLPLVLLEYGMISIPVIATNVGDCYKIIEPNITGLLIDAKDDKSLTNSILSLIEDETLRFRLTSNLRRHVLKDYGVKKATERLSLVYNQIENNT